MSSTGCAPCRPEGATIMQGYVVRQGNQHYAVIYEGLDPISGQERRRWHPAGPDRSEAEALVRRLAADRMADRSPRRSSLTVGVYLTQRWLPANQARLRPSTWAGCDANVRLHIVPRIGRVPLRHLRPDHVERMYSDLSVDGNHVPTVASTPRPCSRSTRFCAARWTTPSAAG